MARRTKHEQVTDVVPRQSKAGMARERGLELLAESLGSLGYLRDPSFAHAMFLSDRVTPFGRCGVEISGGVMARPTRLAWVLHVNVVLYNRRVDEVLSRVFDEQPRGTHAAGPMVSLMELVRDKWRNDYTVVVRGPDEDLDRIVGRIRDDVQAHADGWFAMFDDPDRAYPFLRDEPTRHAERNHMAGTVMALERGDTEVALTFARTLGTRWKPAMGQAGVEQRTGSYRRIGKQFEVDLPLVTWDEVRARPTG